MESARPRLNREHIQRRAANNKDDSTFMLKTIRQLIVCAIISAFVFTVAKVDAPACKNITNSIKNTLVYTIDYKAASARLFDIASKLPNIFATKASEQPAAEQPASEQPAAVEGNADAATD